MERWEGGRTGVRPFSARRLARKRVRVAVLYGGRSAEHEVSVQSAISVMNAADAGKYEMFPIGIGKDGAWHVDLDPRACGGAIESPASRAPEVVAGEQGGVADPVPFGVTTDPVVVPSAVALQEREVDVVFPVLHGPWGEDGTIQGLLEILDLPYVGSGVAASAVGMDKALMRAIFRDAGLPVLDDLVILRHRWRSDPSGVTDEIVSKIGFPCFVKPANMGSSVGVSRADDHTGLRRALDEAARFDRKLVVEEAAANCLEVECSVLGDDHPEASLPGEIRPAGSFYDYESKYVDEATELIIPAPLDAQLTERVRKLALDAFTAVDASGLGRVDFFVERNGDRRVWVNEINTLPGFTRASMYPKLWEASGLPYPRLIDRLIELAFERHAARKRAGDPL